MSTWNVAEWTSNVLNNFKFLNFTFIEMQINDLNISISSMARKRVENDSKNIENSLER